MSKRDLTLHVGDVFGVWTILEDKPLKIDGKSTRRYKIRCECGKESYQTKNVIFANKPIRNICTCAEPPYKSIRKGDVFTRLTVISDIYYKIKQRPNQYKVKSPYFKCQCICGTVKEVNAHCLLDKSVKSCGCLRVDTGRKNVTHGLSKTSFYKIWVGFHQRCGDLNNPNYGGRGIKVGKDFETFESFHKLMYPTYKPGLSLDRIDVNGDYTFNNVRWATNKVQSRNKQGTRYGEDPFTGEVLSLKDMAERYGIAYKGILQRSRSGKTGVALLNGRNSFLNHEWTFLTDEDTNAICQVIQSNTTEEAAKILKMSIIDVLIIEYHKVKNHD